MLYTVLVYRAEDDETGYWAKVAELPGCYTQGESVEEIQSNIKDAIETYLDVLERAGKPHPAEVALKFDVAVA